MSAMQMRPRIVVIRTFGVTAIGYASSELFPLSVVHTHELRLGDDVSFHRLLDIALSRARRKIELVVQRVELEEVAMLPIRRTRTAPRVLPPSVFADDALRRLAFRRLRRLRRDVPDDPVVPRATGR